MSRIAIVGLACRYPDADSPDELWTNVLAGRRAFRQLPDERMRLADYWSPDPASPDQFYARQAAVIKGYQFDRVGYRVAGSTYRSTDLTHWLALDVAAQALADAGFPDGDELPRERTGVVVGNTLTGEFARANLMRLRWPYVRRTLAAALREEGWEDGRLAEFLTSLEERYKQPFPPIDEDSLAGGLANTIAGRICNHYDLKGGGYTVDGACSSSLLSVATACRSLRDHEVDLVIAGGVDLSIDPFEIVGFAKTGALATGEMLVYDRRSSGFWPGEGCGMVVLMREEEARAAGHRVYATIAGYGISSDGKGGITRPEVAGYRLALRRAYRQAGFGVDTVSLFEGHGTGTPVGNEVELTALSTARRLADPSAPAAAIGSIKAMIGHTKAAAGVAGLIKAVLAVHHEVLPPTVGCVDPHPVLRESSPALRVLPGAEPWPTDSPVRAAVTAMGFGGINTHVVVENPRPKRRGGMAAPMAAVSRHAAGDGAELLVLDADDQAQLRERVAELLEFVPRLSFAELGDIAVTTQRAVTGGRYRAAVVARSPEEAEARLRVLAESLEQSSTTQVALTEGVWVGQVDDIGRVGFLFPGQGSGNQPTGGALRRRFATAEEAYAQAALSVGADTVATAVAQPRIVTGSLAGMRVLASLGIKATVAVGHSLGELAALHWAGSLDGSALLRLAEVRGRVMTEHSDPGTMAGIGAEPTQVAPLLVGTEVVIAGHNGPRQTVVAGPEPAVKLVCERAAAIGFGWSLLPVSHAFHSPLVARSAGAFASHLAGERFDPVSGRVMSTVTGKLLPADTDLAALLERQITEPVRFTEALTAAAAEVDLLIEVGPGAVLSRLAGTISQVPVVPIDTDNRSLAPLWNALAAAFVVGVPVRFDPLHDGRPDRRLEVGAELSFFASPCEIAPDLDGAVVPVVTGTGPPPVVSRAVAGESKTSADTVDLLRELVATRAELPTEMVQADSLLLDDLHLSSITVGQVFVQAAQQLGLPPGQAPTSFATATLNELASALDELRATSVASDTDQPATVAGVDDWVRPFRIELRAASDAGTPGQEPNGEWQVYAGQEHPLAEPLRWALERGGVGGGVLLCLTAECQEPDLALALAATKAAVSQPAGRRLVVVQQGQGAAALAKTARLETPQLRTTVIDTALVPEVVPAILAEVAATTGFREVVHDDAGNRWVPVLRPMHPEPGSSPLTDTDVLLVTGGGRGITAECAISLATDSGARLGILGRSDPASEPELAANLARMEQAGLTVRYVSADVTDSAAVRSAIADIEAEWGPVTAILHGAGGNQPAGLTNLEVDDFRKTLAPKVDGLAAVLAAVDESRLRLVVTFGSIIGRAGLRGEGHYATANDWLAVATTNLAQRLPNCRVVCLEWSVWAGVGMGERLSVVQSLIREGITPITVDQGVEVLRRLVADPAVPSVVVITGRAEGVDTVSYGRPPLPLLRFVDKPLIHYPEVELVVETRLSPGSDLYLNDHLLDGDLLFPAVLGMEAMAQVATALRGRAEPPVFECAEFIRPVVVPREGETTIRIAALASGPDSVEVVIRSSESGFGADHFRARLRFDLSGPLARVDPAADPQLPPVPLEPAAELYGDLLFQGDRFQRLSHYRRVAARYAQAEVSSRPERWFASFLPATLVLSDPGARDAFMHGLQVCVPTATLLPAGFERVYPAVADRSDPAALTFTAVERSNEGDTYIYDISVQTPDGTVVERWEGLRLQAVRKLDDRPAWPPPLLGPFLQRRLGELLDPSLVAAIEVGAGAEGRAGTALALRRALHRDVELGYRPDGRPEVAGGPSVTASHGAGVTLVVAAATPVGCDVELVVARPASEWAALLNPHERLMPLLLAAGDGDGDLAATRIWCALEALQKCGGSRPGPMTVDEQPAPGWVVFRAGGARIATFVTSFKSVEQPVVLAVAVRGEDR